MTRFIASRPLALAAGLAAFAAAPAFAAGDSADTPYTAIRGDANQFILGLGVAFTF